MLHSVTIPMHLNGGGLVTLQAVLARLPANDLLWRILHFDGVGTAPGGTTMEEFERAVRASPDGHNATWGELISLSAGLEQTWDCLIVGSPPHVPIEADTIEAAGFPGCEVVIEALDSSRWTVGIMDWAVCSRLKAAGWADSTES